MYSLLSADDEHDVTVAAETVFLLKSRFIGLHYQLIAAESCNHHEHGRIRHMEVGNQVGGHSEIIRRENEAVGPPVVCLHMAAHAFGCYNGTEHRCSHSHNSVILVAGMIHSLDKFWRGNHLFRIHAMFGKVFHINLAESSQPAVDSHECFLHAVDLQTRKQSPGEVQTGSRSNDSAFLIGEYTLLVFGIACLGLTSDIGRQRCHTKSIEVSLEFIVRPVVKETERAAARSRIVNHFRYH